MANCYMQQLEYNQFKKRTAGGFESRMGAKLKVIEFPAGGVMNLLSVSKLDLQQGLQTVLIVTSSDFTSN